MVCRVAHTMSLEDLTDLERELLRRSDGLHVVHAIAN